MFNNLSHSITIKTKNKKTIKKNYEKSFINVYRNIYNFLNNKKYTCSNIDNAKKVHQIIDISSKKNKKLVRFNTYDNKEKGCIKSIKIRLNRLVF